MSPPREHPVLLSDMMVRALLAGRKTQTRRLRSSPLRRVQPADRLWVREGFRLAREEGRAYQSLLDGVLYRADDPAPESGLWKPGIHMPRWAARIVLEVTATRSERLQDITEADAIAEGIEPIEVTSLTDAELGGGTPKEIADYRSKIKTVYRNPVWRPGDTHDDPRYGLASSAYMRLWLELHQKPGTGWHDNPEVLVISFRLLEAPRGGNGRG